ncbi:hypothetical protein [Solitalea koreensis]|uniref:Lipocalin-like domain-containing protein n=1 Tax=Solitalea koreensis TaxID=543615 RepID=A0A521ECB4_9SPHI|nr:hypothetical protein [Solitalea koreensis]SMO81555.1 hypothetical protein SAMN06265350_11340 [Solitalea koreensis]
MKNLFKSLFILLSFTTLFSSCEKQETASPEVPSGMVGVWEAQSADVKILTHSNVVVEQTSLKKDQFAGEYPIRIEFTADKLIYSYLKNGVTVKEEISYYMNTVDNKIHIKGSSGEDIPLIYVVKGYTLTVLFVNGSTPDFSSHVNVTFIKKF